MARGRKKKSKSVETLTHGEAARRNIPTAEYHLLTESRSVFARGVSA